MIVDRKTRRLAMFLIYRIVRRERGATMRAKDLEHEWPKSGLRQADLQSALSEMTLSHFLLAAGDGTQATYQLTSAGVSEFHRPGRALFYHFGQWGTLVRVRMRKLWYSWHAPYPSPHDRRMSRTT